MFIVSKIVGRLNRNAEEKYWHSDDVNKTKHLDLPELTSEEFLLLQKTWPCFRFGKKDVIWAKLYKKEYGFDPYFISSGYHSIVIKDRINPYEQICSLENKALVDSYFFEIPYPETYIRCINNILYDKKMNRISFEKAVRLLMEKIKFCKKWTMFRKNGLKNCSLMPPTISSFKRLLSNIQISHASIPHR